MESTFEGGVKVSFQDKLNLYNQPSERAKMLLEKWDESVFQEIVRLEDEVNKEHQFHQKKYDISCKLPKNGWGRGGLASAADEAMAINDYCFLLVQAEDALDQMKARIKGLYYLLGWNEIKEEMR